jgi:hypothetical protein
MGPDTSIWTCPSTPVLHRRRWEGERPYRALFPSLNHGRAGLLTRMLEMCSFCLCTACALLGTEFLGPYCTDLLWLPYIYRTLGCILFSLPSSTITFFSSPGCVDRFPLTLVLLSRFSIPPSLSAGLILHPDMLPAFLALSTTFLVVFTSVSGRPMVTQRGHYKQLRQEPLQLQGLAEVVGSFPEINVLVEGNQRFRDSIASSSNPNLLKEQTDEGQSPEFLFPGCGYVGPFTESLGCQAC